MDKEYLKTQDNYLIIKPISLLKQKPVKMKLTLKGTRERGHSSIFYLETSNNLIFIR
jgi:hypothetical protein